MPLSDIVGITISTSAAAVTQAGFGVPLILSSTASFSERIRFYTDLTGMVADGFTSATAEYKAAAAMFAQSPRPVKVAVGRRANKPTMRWNLTPTAVNSKLYRVVVDGQNADYTSDGSATAAEITAGLKIAIDALGLALTTTDLTTSLRVAANTAGAWHSLAPADAPLGSLIDVAMDHADAGVAADLDAILLADNTWYAIIGTSNSNLEARAIAAWAEANTKLYLCQSQDTANATAALNAGGSDLANQLKNSAYARTAVLYHPDNSQFCDAAWAGARLPLDPGSETWMFAQLAGVSAVSLTATQITNLKAKVCNFYYTVGGVNIVSGGWTSSGSYVDFVRGRDWLQARLQERIFGLLASSNKVPYTDEGVARIEAQVRAQLKEAQAVGFLAATPAPTVTVPLVATVSGADKASRTLRNVSFTATTQGALHNILITGVVSV